MKQPTAPHFPAAAIPFLRFLLGAGRPMKRPTAPNFPAAAIPFLRFLWARGEINDPPRKGQTHASPGDRHPFLRFRWGAGRPMKRPTAPHFPAVAKTFFKISLGGRGAFLGKKGPPHSHPPSRHPPALLRDNERSGGRRSVRKRSANPQNPKRRNRPALSAPRRNPHSGRALPRAAAGNRRRRRRGPENFSRIAHFLLLFLKKILTSGIFCAILYKT